MNERHSVNPNIFLWRNRFQAINLFTKIVLVLNGPPTIDVGSEMEEWRKLSKSYNVISRQIIVALTNGRKGIRLPAVELALDGEYSKSTIIKCAKEGVRLGLLTANKGRYYGTQKLYDAAFQRCMVKLRDPDIISFARFVMTMNSINQIAAKTAEMERDSEYKGDYKTMYEEMVDGKYHSEIMNLPDHNDYDSGSNPV